MRISIIAAMDRRGLIGDASGLPWHLPMDLRRFRTLTWGKPILMGRKTFELIGRPLPGRLNIVITRNPQYSAAGCSVAHTLPQALALAEDYLASAGADEAFIIGGGEIYAQAIRSWDRMYLTIVEGDFKGNTFFPVGQLLQQRWRPACPPERHPADDKNLHAHSFHIIERATDERNGPPPSKAESLPRAGAGSDNLVEGLDLAATLARGTADSRVTIHMAASLDGFIARKDGGVDWLETADEFADGDTMDPGFVDAFLKTIGCYVMGSRTYETALRFEAQGLGWSYGDKPTFVLTTRDLPRTRDTVEFYSGDLAQLVNGRLRPRFRTIWFVGGGAVSDECLRRGLADEVYYSILPILIGDGIPFFGKLDRDIALHLAGVRAYKSGMVELRYEVRRDRGE